MGPKFLLSPSLWITWGLTSLSLWNVTIQLYQNFFNILFGKIQVIPLCEKFYICFPMGVNICTNLQITLIRSISLQMLYHMQIY